MTDPRDLRTEHGLVIDFPPSSPIARFVSFTEYELATRLKRVEERLDAIQSALRGDSTPSAPEPTPLAAESPKTPVADGSETTAMTEERLPTDLEISSAIDAMKLLLVAAREHQRAFKEKRQLGRNIFRAAHAHDAYYRARALFEREVHRYATEES